MNNVKQSRRIQTSFLNGRERQLLLWLAARMPQWVTSDMLTVIGVFGAFVTGLGFALTNWGIGWLWLSTLGLFINWFGDSLDGTLARYRNTQRPIYGYYIDHTIDCINEAFMFIGAGLSPLIHLNLALSAFTIYLMLTINVSMNAHLKSEFRLTYAKLGPTEFRLLIIIANTLLICMPSLASLHWTINFCSIALSFSIFDFLALLICFALSVIYLTTIIGDARRYASIDPLPKRDASSNSR
ncbi:MAG: CDP-alcohol phosphatidyltransferase family protein [Bacteroidales bacterium]|nr:CDP-alcohol phosphatidyltransferase family protein [Bacteroidales bacterium]